MSWLGDVASFESFNLGEMWNKIKKDPERAFIGAADPFSSKVWGTILNKDYEPVVDQWGGASADTYDKAKDAGINTGPGGTMHGIARTIASMYAGGAAAGAMGGGGASSGGGLLQSSNPSLSSMNGGTGLLASSPGQGFQAGQGLNVQFAGLGQNAAGSSSGIGGLLSEAKPYMDAASTGMQVANSMKDDKPPIPAPQIAPTMPNNNLGQLVQSNEQGTQQQMMADQQAREARKQRLRGAL